jgi:hypothetical protein
VESYHNKTYTEYGDLKSQTTSEISLKAVFNTYGHGENPLPEGIMSETRFSFFFKGDTTGLEERGIVVRSTGERWSISKIFKHTVRGTPMVIECAVNNP